MLKDGRGRRKRDPYLVKRGIRFAEKIRKMRKQKKWTQEELARESRVSVNIIRAIEHKSLVIPNVFIAHDLTKALGERLDKWMEEI